MVVKIALCLIGAFTLVLGDRASTARQIGVPAPKCTVYALQIGSPMRLDSMVVSRDSVAYAVVRMLNVPRAEFTAIKCAHDSIH